MANKMDATLGPDSLVWTVDTIEKEISMSIADSMGLIRCNEVWLTLGSMEREIINKLERDPTALGTGEVSMLRIMCAMAKKLVATAAEKEKQTQQLLSGKSDMRRSRDFRDVSFLTASCRLHEHKLVRI